MRRKLSVLSVVVLVFAWMDKKREATRTGQVCILLLLPLSLINWLYFLLSIMCSAVLETVWLSAQLIRRMEDTERKSIYVLFGWPENLGAYMRWAEAWKLGLQ